MPDEEKKFYNSLIYPKTGINNNQVKNANVAIKHTSTETHNKPNPCEEERN